MLKRESVLKWGGCEGSSLCFPLFLRKHAFHSPLSRLGTLGCITVSSAPAPLWLRHPARHGPARGPGLAAAVTWPWGARQRGVPGPLACLLPCRSWFDGIQIFQCLEGPGHRPRGLFKSRFSSTGDASIFLPHKHKGWWDRKSCWEREPDSLVGENIRSNACVPLVVLILCVFHFSGLEAGGNHTAGKHGRRVQTNTAGKLQPTRGGPCDPDSTARLARVAFSSCGFRRTSGDDCPALISSAWVSTRRCWDAGLHGAWTSSTEPRGYRSTDAEAMCLGANLALSLTNDGSVHTPVTSVSPLRWDRP